MNFSRMILAAVAMLSASGAGLGTSVAQSSPLPVTHKFLYSFAVAGEVESIAVSETTHDIYVQSAGRLYKYSETGEPGEFSALKASFIEGVTTSTWGSQVAVDDSAAVTKGDIYVAGNNVLIFAASGESLGELNIAGSEDDGAAVDPAGRFYVANGNNYGGWVYQFTPAFNPVTTADRTGGISGIVAASLAADSESNVYVVQRGELVKYDAAEFTSTAPTGTRLLKHAGGVATDRTDNHVIAIDPEGPSGPQLVELDSAGDQTGEPFAGEYAPRVVAVDGPKQNIVVGKGEEVDVFSGPLPLPEITVGTTSEVTETSATLHAAVNPHGLGASCEVEYGTDTAYGNTVPCEPASVGSGTSPVSVAARLSGVESGVVYHYRFAASNENGTERSADQTFATLHAPVIDGQRVLSVTGETVVLEGVINPKHAPTAYHFEYGTTTAYGSVSPSPDITIGPFDDDRAVIWTLEGLQPETLYHYRLVASNATGTAYGPDQTFKTYPGGASAADSCPNAPIRQAQFSSFLPDCRAYELVTPAEKEGAQITSQRHSTIASLDGNAVKFISPNPFGDAQGSETPGAEYISQRGAEGWTTHGVNPQQKSIALGIYIGPHYAAFSEDLSKGVFIATSPLGAGHPNVEDAANLYLRTDALGAPPGNYELLSDSVTPDAPLPAIPVTDFGVAFAAASSDFSHILFETSNDLTPESVGLDTSKPKLYEWHDGTVKLAGILPNGEPASSSIAGNGAGGGPLEALLDFESKYTFNTMSRDGSRVIFEVNPAPKLIDELTDLPSEDGLFMRIDDRETIKLNASERSEPEPAGQPVIYRAATPDGSKVLFSTGEALTDDTPPSGGFNLYMYDVNAPAHKHLTLIAAGSKGASSLPNMEKVVGVSEDGNYVYFIDEQELVPGLPPHTAAEHYLYVWHDGALRYIAGPHYAGNGNGEVVPVWDWKVVNIHEVTGFDMTPDGRHILFSSADPEVAESAGVAGQVGSTDQAYLWSYDTGKLTCVSCNPSGAAATGSVSWEAPFNIAEPSLARPEMYIARAISSDGRYVFFDTPDALLPRDTNGQFDVYEYDALTDRLHLLSSGTCACESHFADAGPDGRNVFIATAQKLVPADIDTNVDMYDVRVEGGIPAQNVPPREPCEGDDCQGPAKATPGFSLPASSTFFGQESPVHKAGKPSLKRIGRSQRLARALKACKRKAKRRRAKCRAQAYRRYGARRAASGARRTGR